MIIMKYHSSTPVGSNSYCVVFVGNTLAGKEFFIPVNVDGDDGRMVYDALNGEINNPLANGTAAILSMLEQVEQTALFVNLVFDDVNGDCRTYLATYYDTEVASKFYRSEIPLHMGLLISMLSADQIQITVGDRVVESVGVDMNVLETQINRR